MNGMSAGRAAVDEFVRGLDATRASSRMTETFESGAMHALGRFISELMDARAMSRPQLERASGLSRQHLHQLLDERKTRLGRMLDDATITGLGRAFPDVGEHPFIAKAAESMGVPVGRLTVVDVDFDRLSDEALLGILARRLKRAAEAPADPGTRAEPGTPSDAGEASSAPLAARHGRRERQHLDDEWDQPDGRGSGPA